MKKIVIPKSLVPKLEQVFAEETKERDKKKSKRLIKKRSSKKPGRRQS